MIDILKNIFGIWRINGEEKGEIFMDLNFSFTSEYKYE